MRKIQIIGLALFAMFAFAAVSVTTASAETTLLAEWLVEGKPVTASTATVNEGELLLEDMSTATDVLCSGKFVGTIGANGVDSITLVEDLEAKDNLLNCIITAKGACEEANGSLILVTPVNLPWATKLILMENGEFLDEIFSSGVGNPGYLIECKALGIKVDDTCTGITQTQEKNVTGGVEGIFNESEAITPAGNCTIGGEKAGLVVGSGHSTSPIGLTVSSE
jgi:hypothetical protein